MPTISTSDIGIIADDLTGACDVAACLAATGGAVPVISCGSDGSLEARTGLYVINTQSRLLSAAKSRAVLKSVGKCLASKQVLFKKIDTALRGPIGAELEGLLEAVGDRRVVIAPALPNIGRVTREGVQYDNDLPVHLSVYGADPVSPIDSSEIAKVFLKTGQAKFVVRDAVTNEDLQKIVSDYLDGTKVVLVGSLGLADALAASLENETTRQPITSRSARPMLICGSAYERSHQQIDLAVTKVGATVIDIDPLGESTVEQKKQGPANRPLIVKINRGRCTRAKYEPWEILSPFIEKVMAIIETHRPDGLGIIGGQTAYEMLNSLEVTGIRIYGKLGEVAAYGRLMGGTLGERPIVLKGGSVGTEDEVVRMFQYLNDPEGVSN